ncbi:MAG: DPP IV N-terminal domain-containing protein, partial [Anaerolineae bacterium]|nr:DPP IV N-terminal domain-containing protein [Anaerolineae bacterium]
YILKRVLRPNQVGEPIAVRPSGVRLRRVRDRLAYILKRVLRPNQVGEPIAVRPSGVRLRRVRDRLAHILKWVFRPNQVGKPIAVKPSGVRLLVLLVVGNIAVLVLLAVALYGATLNPPTVESPLQIVVTRNVEPSPAPGLEATPFGTGGAIAFTLRRDGNADIYAINQLDRQLIRLTYDPAEDRQPAWSPDGNYIAFASNRARNWDIYLLDLVSGALIRLTHDPEFDANPSWSPDGEWIAFESYRQGSLDIYVMSTTGQQVHHVMRDPAPDYAPAWSPDSQAIVFTSFRDNNKDIFVYLLAENELINITQSPDLDEDTPVWSPDGAQLAFVSGPRGNPSVQVTTFDWNTLTTDQNQTELFGSGKAPAWAPDGQNLIYTYERGERSYLVATSMQEWALFQEVYSTNGNLEDLAWTQLPLSPRVVARAQAAEPAQPAPFYIELVQPTPSAAPPYRLVQLPDVNESDDERLCDRVNESFNALRQRVLDDAGWDYLGTLDASWEPIASTPPSGQSRMNWHLCGRAFALDQDPYEADDPTVELIREDLGSVTYWRVLLRAAEQDGSMGEPLREVPWDLNARSDGGPASVDGGAYKDEIPSGYYTDFTTLASDYGWDWVPSLWRWRYFWADIRWWEFQNVGDLNWWRCMLDVYEPGEIEDAFGPIPGQDD